jgi:NAD(P)H-dependent FMN reductase
MADELMNIVILSASVRSGRKSNRVSLFFKDYIKDNNLASAEIVDLKQYQFPVFDERLKFQTSPLKSAIEFADKIKSADGIIIVTPEYNGGYPASLKNAIDLLTEEWKRKPIAISTVSEGEFGGSQVIISLQFSLWKLHALVVPVMFPVSKIENTFNTEGIPKEKEITEKRAAKFMEELLWYIKAQKLMKEKVEMNT